jgi:hypothetical protein
MYRRRVKQRAAAEAFARDVALMQARFSTPEVGYSAVRDIEPVLGLVSSLINLVPPILENWDNPYFKAKLSVACQVTDCLVSFFDALGALSTALDKTTIPLRAQLHAIAPELSRINAKVIALEQRRANTPVMSLAGRLLSVAAQLLPASDRARYGEEFRSELTDIAHAGGGRRVQLCYAARQALRVLRLRIELKYPRRSAAQ